MINNRVVSVNNLDVYFNKIENRCMFRSCLYRTGFTYVLFLKLNLLRVLISEYIIRIRFIAISKTEFMEIKIHSTSGATSSTV